MLSSLAPPWTSFQFYDVISDVWTTKTALGGNLLSALGTDFAIEVITEESAFYQEQLLLNIKNINR
jgi:hypothetical protein